MRRKTFCTRLGLSKQSLGVLEDEDELTEREEGLLQDAKDFSSSREEAEAWLVVEQARGRRGFLRLKEESSESESEGEGEPRPRAPYVLRFFSESVKSRVGGEEGVRGCSGRGSNFGGGVVGSVLGPLLPLRLRRFWNCEGQPERSGCTSGQQKRHFVGRYQGER